MEGARSSINPDPVAFAESVREPNPDLVCHATSHFPDKVILIVGHDGHKIGCSVVVLAEALCIGPGLLLRNWKVTVAREVLSPPFRASHLGCIKS